MTRPYLILVNGVLARKTLTLGKAKLVAAELKTKGFNNVSIAEEMQ